MKKCGFMFMKDGSTHICYYDKIYIWVEFDFSVMRIRNSICENIDADISISEVNRLFEYKSSTPLKDDIMYLHSGKDVWIACELSARSIDYTIVNVITSDFIERGIDDVDIIMFKENSISFKEFMASVM